MQLYLVPQLPTWLINEHIYLKTQNKKNLHISECKNCMTYYCSDFMFKPSKRVG